MSSTANNLKINENFKPSYNPFDQCGQLIVVLAENIGDWLGKLYQFERQDDQWKALPLPISVTLGKNGMIWGYGLLPFEAIAGAYTIEGDYMTPAGIFEIGTAFGYKSLEENILLPYRKITEMTACIEDIDSKYYNIILEADQVDNDWRQADFMLRKDDLYRWGFVLKNNTPPKPNRGSCIFYHVWRENGTKPTAGCVGMSERHILDLLHWLDASKTPRVVHATLELYEQFCAWFDLPLPK